MVILHVFFWSSLARRNEYPQSRATPGSAGLCIEAPYCRDMTALLVQLTLVSVHWPYLWFIWWLWSPSCFISAFGRGHAQSITWRLRSLFCSVPLWFDSPGASLQVRAALAVHLLVLVYNLLWPVQCLIFLKKTYSNLSDFPFRQIIL